MYGKEEINTANSRFEYQVLKCGFRAKSLFKSQFSKL